MELNNEEVKKILEQSFDKIMKMQNERGLTFDELKDLLVEILYDITLYGKKKVSSTKSVEAKKIDVRMQPLYGPPPIDYESEEFVLDYGKENTPTVKKIDMGMPQILYGPPPLDNVTIYEMDYSQRGSDLNGMFEKEADSSMEHGNEYIPGTNIWKPRDKGIYESDDDYTAYLDAYYSLYFPKSGNKRK